MSNFPEKKIQVLLHALGISHIGSEYIQPNKKYLSYSISYRNYFQDSSDEIWDKHVQDGYAKFVKGSASWQDCYFVTENGKQYLRDLGYKWNDEKD